MTITSLVATLNDRGLTPLFSAWLAWSAKGTILLFFAWIVTVLLRRRTAAMRHLVWSSALAAMLLLPAFERVVPAIHVGWLADLRAVGSERARIVSRPDARKDPGDHPSRLESGGHSAARGAERIALPSTQLPAVPIQDLSFDISNSAVFRISPLLLASGIWLAVMTLLLARALAGVVQLSVWARRAESVDDVEWLSLTNRLAREMQIGRPVTMLRSDRAHVPMTWGIVYPRILLPEDADSWVAARRTVVLLHELAHIKRLDTLTQLLAQVSTALFWFHPGVWFAAREMRREREHACDDFVLDAGARASDYAHSLLQIARPLVNGAPAAAALAMARTSELEGRLLAILDPRINRRPASRIRLAFASVAMIGLAIPLAAVTPSRAAVHHERTAGIEFPAAEAPVAALIVDEPAARATAGSRTPVAQAPVPEAVDDTARIAVAGLADTPPLDLSVPPPTVAVERPAWPRHNVVARIAKPTPDVETLIAVTRAATKMTSDHEKAEVLLTVARHYVPDDGLRSAYFDAVLSMHNDFDRARVLEPVLEKDTLPESAAPHLVRIAEAMGSDNGRVSLILRVANSRQAVPASTRSALVSLTASLRSDFERGRAITAIARRRNLSAADAVRLISTAKAMSSSTEKANALLAIATNRALDTPELRKAYLNAAETISSPYDYRRAVVRVIE